MVALSWWTKFDRLFAGWQVGPERALGAGIKAGLRVERSGDHTLVCRYEMTADAEKPVLLEPVKAAIRIAGRQITAVNVLDHDGNRTDKTVEVKDGKFTIDGGWERTFYYEVVFR